MSIPINSTNFPDDIFRNFVIHNIASGSETLSDSLIASTKNMDVSTLGISSLQGIEFFQHLEVLLCSYNNISSLDISTLTSLLTLACNKNNLSALDLSHQSELLHLQCSYNDIRSLDLSQNTELNSLFCDHNQITFLNLELNTSLREISCQSQTIKGISVYFNPDFELPYQINLTELVGTIYTSKIFRVRPSEDFSFTYDNNGLLHLSNTPRYVIYYYDTGLNDIDFFVKVYIKNQLFCLTYSVMCKHNLCCRITYYWHFKVLILHDFFSAYCNKYFIRF